MFSLNDVHASIVAYQAVHPRTIFVLPDVADIEQDNVLGLTDHYPRRHLVVTTQPAAFPNCVTINARTEARLIARRADDADLVLIACVRATGDVTLAESLVDAGRIVVAAFEQPQTDVQLAWSALGGECRTFVLGFQRQADEVMRQYYSVPEAAKILGVTTATAYNHAKDEIIPSIRLKGRVLIPIKAFHEQLDRQQRGASATDERNRNSLAATP
jgi:hypothetical protein